MEDEPRDGDLGVRGTRPATRSMATGHARIPCRMNDATKGVRRVGELELRGAYRVTASAPGGRAGLRVRARGGGGRVQGVGGLLRHPTSVPCESRWGSGTPRAGRPRV